MKKINTDKVEPKGEKEEEEEKEPNKEKDYKIYLDRYFEIKNKYEEKQRKRNKKTGKKEKAEKMDNKNKCIKCQNSGGVIFSNSNNRYTAVCGAEQPCKLHIELYRGFFFNSTNLLYDYIKILEQSKETIIMLQNNDLFHFEQDKLKKKYEDEKKQYETLTHLFTDLEKCLYNNQEIKDKIKAKIDDINKVIIEIRSTIQDYKKTKKEEYIQNAMEHQKNNLLPLLDELRSLKYEIVETDINQRTKTNRYLKGKEEIVEKRDVMESILIEREVSLDKMEMNLKEPPAVVKWEI